MDRLLQLLLDPIVHVWRAVSPSSWRALPTPSGEPVAHAPRPNADHLLLVGGGIAVGYGVLSHDLALGGRLARRLSALTGRGALVDILAGPDEEMSGAPALLGTVNLAGYDAMVATYGGSESARLLAPTRWRLQLTMMLDYVERTAPLHFHVFVVAVPLIAGIPGVWGRQTERRTVQFNEQSRLECENRSLASFVSMASVPIQVQEPMNRRTYDEWAAIIAPQLVEVLGELAVNPG
ncbi:MAG: diguanylate cyclase [Microbacteriaceae bacterium]|nr:diguanylate cyclase [Microbacteriaceae bacterium]